MISEFHVAYEEFCLSFVNVRRHFALHCVAATNRHKYVKLGGGLVEPFTLCRLKPTLTFKTD